MAQVISIMDHYAYRSLVRGVYVERIANPRRGLQIGIEKLDAACRDTRICLRALNDLVPGGEWLAGRELSLADLHSAPMFALLMETPDARELMEPHKRLCAWWRKINEHVASAQILSAPTL